MAGTCLPSSAKPGAPLEAPQQEDHPDVGGPAGEDAVEERAPLADRTNKATEGGVAAAKEVPGGSKGKGRKAKCGKLLLTNMRGQALIYVVVYYMFSTQLGRDAFQGHWNRKWESKVESRDKFYAQLWSKKWRGVQKWAAVCGEEECRFPSQRTLFEFFDNVVLPTFKAEEDEGKIVIQAPGARNDGPHPESLFKFLETYNAWTFMSPDAHEILSYIVNRMERMKRGEEVSIHGMMYQLANKQ